MPINPLTDEELPITYYGPRFKDSLEMHKAFANQENIAIEGGSLISSYKFKFPPNMNVIEALQVG